jgi:hypothetical protein
MLVRRATLCTLAALVLIAVAAEGQAKSGTPITACGQVVTTSAFLTGDLSCAGMGGVVVGASGITIDLKGFSLRGDGSHYGIDDNDGFDGVKVENGVLRNFQRGVHAANGADKLALSDVVVAGSTGFGAYVDGDSVVVKSSTFAGNGADGIEIVGTSASVRASTAVGNQGEGLFLFGASASVASTTASGNAHSGVAVLGNGAVVRLSTFSGNRENGIEVDGNSATVKSSILSGNTFEGISISGDSASVSSSGASGNGAGGVLVIGDAAQIKGNRAEADGFSGGAADGAGLGIEVPNASLMTTPPVGTNVARGNDDSSECNPLWLC